MKKYNWTEEKIELLKTLYPNENSQKIADQFGFSIYAIYRMACSLGLKKSGEFLLSDKSGRLIKGKTRQEGVHYQFPKGHVPMNKGKKQKEFMTQEAIDKTKATRFKKGQLPHNTKPIGYERIDKDGYLYYKVEGKRKLVLKHRHVWEQHNGSIPKGYNIQFKDGNKHNCDIENLYMISRANQMAKENSASKNLPDNAVAVYLAGKRGSDKVFVEQLKQYPELIQLKRNQILLNRKIKEQNGSNRQTKTNDR
ncbi:HNH endonuclease [Dysgonomonas sp. HDW5A]|uniref:HNH endonuclease n=1 Tax=Dysgonomonas sp. HDW5A TaxID=2714926 RepID=UPI00140E7366|nr:HNH endonuclease [Dysgonomonas sp. HDW5A]QIK58792.1 HNH endonuclease [Dysgonomonas sp. HDW5A]